MGVRTERPAIPRGALALTVAFAGALAGCGAPDSFDAPAARVVPDVGAVVSEHPLATKAGLLVLEAGGNAADAAVATALALSVVYPQAGNLGGGGFAVWVPHEGEARTLDFRETAPAGYTADLYLDADGEVVRARSLATPLAVGVPGSPAGLFALYGAHGSRNLSFAKLCEPAIRLAEEGFTVDAWLERTLASPGKRVLLTDDPGAAALFYPDGEPLRAGDVLVQPQLARTLRILASRGARGFYEGPIAEAIVRDLAEADVRAGGVARDSLLSTADLAAYRPVWRDPVVGMFRGHEVIGMGPPSSGGVALLQVLGILEGMPLDVARAEAFERVELGLEPALTVDPLGRTGRLDDESMAWAGVDARAVHWWLEAMRRAFADRAAHLGDPDHFDVPVDALLSARWLADRRVSIAQTADLEGGAWVRPPAPESTETTHVSVVDGDGNAVSLTTTLNGSFGSGIYVDAAGILLNNELDDFSILAGTPNMYGLVGSDANQLAPMRRPLSSMTPIVARGPAGDVRIVLGAPGGPRIITAVTQVLLRMLAYDQDLVSAIRAPRVHQQWRPVESRLERGWDPRLVEELRTLHDQPLEPATGAVFGSVQGIHVLPSGAVEAYSDPRRGGAGGLEGEDPAPPALLRD